jgi:hypothetical protein
MWWPQTHLKDVLKPRPGAVLDGMTGSGPNLRSVGFLSSIGILPTTLLHGLLPLTLACRGESVSMPAPHGGHRSASI